MFELLFIYASFVKILIIKLFIIISDDNDKKMKETSNGKIRLRSPFEQYIISPGINESFSFVRVSGKHDSPKITSISYINPNENKIDGPYIIHQLNNGNIKDIYCDTHTSDTYYCVLLTEEAGNIRKLTKISFLYPRLVYNYS
jgi:hypothetical protein